MTDPLLDEPETEEAQAATKAAVFTTAERLFEKSQLAAEALGISIADAPKDAATTTTPPALPKPVAPKPAAPAKPAPALRGAE